MASNTEKLGIFNKSLEFSAYLNKIVGEMDRKFKFTIGDRMVLSLDDLCCNIIDANRTTEPARAAQYIYDALGDLDKIEYRLRLSMTLGLLTLKQKANCDMMIDSMRHDSRNWRKYFLNKCKKCESPDSDVEPGESR